MEKWKVAPRKGSKWRVMKTHGRERKKEVNPKGEDGGAYRNDSARRGDSDRA